MQQRTTRSSGKPLEQNWNETKTRNESLQEDDRFEITTFIFNKTDLRIDGILQKVILQDEKQMKDISDVIQKLEEPKVDLAENSNKKITFSARRWPKKIQDQGNAELVELRPTAWTLLLLITVTFQQRTASSTRIWCSNRWIVTEVEPLQRWKVRETSLNTWYDSSWACWWRGVVMCLFSSVKHVSVWKFGSLWIIHQRAGETDPCNVV